MTYLGNRMRFALLSILSILYLGCTDPVTPEFEFQEELIFIEGFASTAPGASFVIINESAIEFGVYVVNFVEGASVSFENVGTGETVPLEELDDAYVPPNDFKADVGEKWKLNIVLSNGKRYESSPELILEAVPITDLQVQYDSELVFREIFGGIFVPGHKVLISFEDPVDQENYYYWTYRTYENLDFCEKCFEGVFRDGECLFLGNAASGFPYFDYICDVDCWQIRYPESIAIFEDRFSNGKTTTNLAIGDLLLYTKENMVIEVQQISLTPAAHEYYKVLKDIIDNNSGLNAPPPAALVGNIFNSDDSEDFVFGRFTAAAASTASIFIDRSSIVEEPLEIIYPTILEPTFNSPFPPPATNFAPCSETRYRTAIRPEKWMDK